MCVCKKTNQELESNEAQISQTEHKLFGLVTFCATAPTLKLLSVSNTSMQQFLQHLTKQQYLIL